MMIKVFICDDEQPFADYLKNQLERIFIKTEAKVEITPFISPGECLRAVKQRGISPDVLFLEIDMPGMSGFDLADAIKKECGDTLIVFVSERQELVFDSFDYNPFSFVRKSEDELFSRELEKVCRRITTSFRQKITVEIINVYSGKEYVSADKILFVKTDDHYLVWQLQGERNHIKERGTMQNAVEKLKTIRFIRPHFRYLVNASHIKVFSTKFKNIVLDSGVKIPVSRSMKASAFRDYTDYLKTL